VASKRSKKESSKVLPTCGGREEEGIKEERGGKRRKEDKAFEYYHLVHVVCV
jgi:hypothetical protein